MDERSSPDEPEPARIPVLHDARLLPMRGILKPTGSIYVHCDPTASHYIKVMMDAIFGHENFRNEIIWQRALAKGLASTRLPSNHDVLLCYGKTSHTRWNALVSPYDLNNLDQKPPGSTSTETQTAGAIS